MQPLSLLFAAVLFALSLNFTIAVPLLRRSATSNEFVSLPLERYDHESYDHDGAKIHPLIQLQQQINRALRRLARMTGETEPSQDTLENYLVRRVLAVEGREGLERRYNRRNADDTVVLERRYNTWGVPEPASPPVGNTLAETPGDTLGTQPNGVTAAKKPTANNSLGLDIEAQDTSYLATIQIGNPPRDFLLLMDSGSADFWVGSENCTSTTGGGCGNHKFLGSQSSSSFTDSGTAFNVKYGTGNVAGNIVTDDINIAGLTITNHTFGVANLESPEFSSSRASFDGLMGLAQSSLSKQQTLTPVEALSKAGLTSAPIVSYKISRLADNKNDGQITFGGLDPAKFDSKTLITVPNVSQRGFWEADLDDIAIDGQSLGLQARTAILDTGTTLAVLPLADAIAIHELIPGAAFDGQGGFTVPCRGSTVVSLTFGGQVFEIDPRDLAFIPLDNDPNGDCISGITAGSVGSRTQWLVGDTFLKNAYFSTDIEKNTVSLAKLV